MLDQRGKNPRNIINTLVANASPVHEGGIIAPLLYLRRQHALSVNTVYLSGEPYLRNGQKIIFLVDG
jgi:hypothetical protein